MEQSHLSLHRKFFHCIESQLLSDHFINSYEMTCSCLTAQYSLKLILSSSFLLSTTSHSPSPSIPAFSSSYLSCPSPLLSSSSLFSHLFSSLLISPAPLHFCPLPPSHLFSHLLSTLLSLPSPIPHSSLLRGKPGPRSADLSAIMDSCSLMAQASDLNLRLMKWRMW